MAVDYAHLMGVCNRDIKLMNILVMGPDDDWPVVKLIDFGTSKHADLDSAPDTCIGTFANMAPEVRASSAQPVRVPIYDGKMADIWSLGMCLYQMIFGVHRSMSLRSENPNDGTARTMVDFPGRGNTETKRDPVSNECKVFLNSMLQHCPKQRMTMDQIWQDPWFQQDLPDGSREYNIRLARERVDQGGQYQDRQSQEELHRILEEARSGS